MGQGAHMGQGKRAWLQLGRAQLICACGTAATSVWSAYGLCPSHFNCLRREWSDLTRMEHAWGKAHTRGRSWVGLIRACGAAATCVWSAYGLRPSHFDCLRQEWSDLTRMEHAWGKAHARGRRWSNGLTTGGDSVG